MYVYDDDDDDVRDGSPGTYIAAAAVSTKCAQQISRL